MRRDGEKRRSFLFEDNVPLSTSFRNIPYLSLFIASHRCVMFFCLKNCLLFFFPLEFLYSHVLQFSLSLSFALFSSPSSIFQVVPHNFLFVSRELKPQNCSWGQTNRITGTLFGKILPTIRGEKFPNFFLYFTFYYYYCYFDFFSFSLNEIRWLR